MKLFFKRLAIFSSFAFLAFIIFEYLLRTFPNTYDVKQKLITKNSSEIEVIFTGTSHVFSGIRPKGIDFNSVNLANNSQSLYYDIQIVKRNLDYLKNLKAVVFEINFFTFNYNLDLGPEYWRNIFYYQTFGIEPQTDKVNLVDFSRLYQLKRNEILNLLQSQEENELYYKELGFGGGENMGKGPTQYAGDKKFNSFSEDYVNFKSAFLIEELSNLLMQLTVRNVDVYFLQVPVSSYLADNIKDSNRLDSTKNILLGFKQKFGTKDLNYFGDSRFSDDLFHDADHLNSKGSEVLTKILNQELKETIVE